MKSFWLQNKEAKEWCDVICIIESKINWENMCRKKYVEKPLNIRLSIHRKAIICKQSKTYNYNL